MYYQMISYMRIHLDCTVFILRMKSILNGVKYVYDYIKYLISFLSVRMIYKTTQNNIQEEFLILVLIMYARCGL